jgi:hypothetical protein
MSETVAEETFYSKLGIPLTGLLGFREAIDANRYTGNVVCAVGEAGIGKTHVVRQAAGERMPDEEFEFHGVTYGAVDPETGRRKPGTPYKTVYLAHMLGEDIHVPYPSKLNYHNLVDLAHKLHGLAAFHKERRNEDMANKFFAQVDKVSDVLVHVDPTAENGVMEYLINKELLDMPAEGILFLDEANRSDKSVIKSVFTLIEDNMIDGREVIPPGVQIVVAINPSDGAYSVNEFEKDHAFRRRLSFIAVTMNPGAWLRYAEGRFHPMVVDFIRALPAHLYDTKIRDAGKIFPCPATWEKVSRLLQQTEKRKQSLTSNGVYHTICGHVGVAAGNAIKDYITDNESVISPDEVIHRYTERSAVRKKVRKMVELARHDVLTELCGSVALTLLTKQPDPEAIAGFVSRFMGDLPREIAVAMVVNKLHSATDGVENSSTYLNELSVALHPHEPYRKLFKDITEAMNKARREAGDAPPDPIS